MAQGHRTVTMVSFMCECVWAKMPSYFGQAQCDRGHETVEDWMTLRQLMTLCYVDGPLPSAEGFGAKKAFPERCFACREPLHTQLQKQLLPGSFLRSSLWV